MPELKDKIIIVTGASSGIGESISLALGKEKATVVLAARNQERLNQVAQEVESRGGVALPITVDVGEEAQVQSMIDRTLESFHRIDILISNAGIGLYSPVAEITGDQLNRLWKTNFLGTFYCIRNVLPVMQRQRRGHIITISSMAGRRGTPLSGGYCATKFAQVGLMDSLRRELQNSEIKTTVVFPGSTETNFFVNLENPSGYPIQRYGSVQKPADVARAVIKAIHHPRAEVITQKFGRTLVLLNAISPRCLDWIIQKTFRRSQATPRNT